MPSVSNFQQSRSLKSSALAEATLSVLHDYDKLMRCQPLVGQIESLSSPPDRARPDEHTPEHRWFRQTEYVSLLPFGIWKKKVVFDNYFKDLPDNPVQASPATSISEVSKNTVEGGVESKCYAPGLEIKAVFKVVKRKGHYSKDTLQKRERYAKDEEAGGGWSVVEESEMICNNIFIKWLSVSQHRAAHKRMLENIVFEASKRAYGGKPAESQ